MTETRTYPVQGMSCQHCVDAVTAELTEVDGVIGVEVDLDAGTVAVTSEQALAVDVVRAAVDEAGYDLVDGSD
jgi:copper ion binding protein